MIHILIIEDDPGLRMEIKQFLENSLYHVSVLEQFDHAVQDALQLSADLILLDLNLPGQSGFEICSQIRAVSEVPVLVVTGRTSSADEVNALLKGGDDYIVKPFQPSVLLAHITAVLKRTNKQAGALTDVYKGVTLDAARGCVYYAGRSVELTKNELKILSCLFHKKGMIVSRAELVEYLWDQKVFLDDNSLSVHMTRIRAKLNGIGVLDFVRTKRGMGYCI